MRIDLHLHSTASDGSLAPDQLVAAAHQGGLDIIALTDHDTAAGVASAARAAEGRLHVIPGIEISANHEGHELHVLGYFIEVDSPELADYQARAVETRRERMRGMLQRLDALGLHVPYEHVEAAAGPDAHALGRPHLARALVQHGHAATIADAFDRLIGNGGVAFLPTDLISACRAIELIHAAGGIAVWAHPRPDLFDRDIRRFVTWGIDGVECFRPRSDAADSLRLETVSRELGLIVTGGSDWHGPWHGRLGAFSVSADDVERFLEKGGI